MPFFSLNKSQNGWQISSLGEKLKVSIWNASFNIIAWDVLKQN